MLGIGPWKDTVVPVVNKYLEPPTDLVARAHALNLQVHNIPFRSLCKTQVCFHYVVKMAYMHVTKFNTLTSLATVPDVSLS